MSDSLKIKTEKAFAGYLGDVLTIGDLTVYQGHTPAASESLPALTVYAENAQQHPEMPTEVGMKIVRLRLKLLVDSAVGDRTSLDTWRDEIEAEMRSLTEIKAALNKPASGPDERAVQAIHFHDVMAVDEPSGRNETDWDEEMVFDVLCEPLAD